MKTIRSILAMMAGLLLPGLLASCHPAVSVHPLDTKADSETAEPRIEGNWESPNFDEIGTEKEIMLRWHIEPNQWGGGYQVEMRPPQDDKSMPNEGWGRTVYDVKLVPLDGKLFFDAQFDEEKFGKDSRDASGLPAGVAPLHLIGRIWVETDFLRIVLLHSSWVDDKATQTLPRVSIGMPGKYDENLAVITPSTEELRKFVVQHADTPDAFSYDTYLCRSGTDCAARAYEDMLSRKPHDGEVLNDAAKLYMTRGNYARAVELWRRCAEIDPANASWRSDVGDGLLFHRDFAGARLEYAAAQKLDPKGTYYQALTAWSYFLEGDFDGAAKALEAYLDSNPDPGADETLLAYFVLQRQGRKVEAEAILKEQTARFRGSAESHLLLLEASGRLTSSLWQITPARWYKRESHFWTAQRALLKGDIKSAASSLGEAVNAGDNGDLLTLAARIELERLPVQATEKPVPKAP